MKTAVRPIIFRFAFFASFLAAFAALRSVDAATVGDIRLDNGPYGRKTVAVVSFSSIQNAVKSIADGLSGIGEEDSAETAKAVVSWLTMFPPFDFADSKREATIILIASASPDEMPGQVAIIPLEPSKGEAILRNSLSAAYGKINGGSVLFCSEAKNGEVPPLLSLVVTKETAFFASDRESLQWIARKWKDGEMPSAPALRKGAVISATFDGSLAGATIGSLIPATVDADLDATVRRLGWFRDLLGKLDSLQVSLSANLHSWNLAARLSPKDDSAKQFFASGIPDGKTLDALPRDAYCVSAGLFHQFASLLPESMVSKYSGASAYSFFTGFGIFPGAAPGTLATELEPFLAGEASSAYVIPKGDPVSARVKTFALADPAGAAAALDSFFSRNISNEFAVVRKPRIADGRKIYGYTLMRQPSDELSDDYVAGAIVLLANLNCIEIAIVGDRLYIVSGPYGTIEKFLAPGALAIKPRTMDSLVPSLGALPEGETPMGCGETQPSRTLLALMQSRPHLERIARQMPRHGGGIAWRISRDGGDAIYEVSLTTSELLALSVLRKFDQRQLGNILINNIIVDSEH